MDNNHYTFWGNGERKDVALSYEDYYDVLACLRDEKLSRGMMYKFKNLWEVNSYGQLWMLFYCLPPAVGLTYLALGRTFRSHSGYRYFFTTLSVMWPISCWFGYTLPLPRRLYTEILTDDGMDGDYVRSSVR